jgi:Zn-dependent protease with chaperone function
MAVFSASDVVHPFDESAKRQLESMTGLQATVQAYMKVFSEREAHNVHLSECLRLGPQQVPEVYRLLPPICDAFGIPEPELYLALGDVNAYTFGHTRTSIVLFSGLLEQLADDEVEAVIAHEAGHILCQHVLYQSMAQVLEAAREIGSFAPIPGLGPLLALASVPVQSALTSWSHKSELSADRAAAAYLGGADAMTRVMFRFAGLRADSPYVHSVELFAQQALEWEALRESRWNRVVQWMLSKQSTHPMLAVRVRELQAWAATPSFARLAEIGADARQALRCGTCAHRVQADWRHCQSCGGGLTPSIEAAPAVVAAPATPAVVAAPSSFRGTATVPSPRSVEPQPVDAVPAANSPATSGPATSGPATSGPATAWPRPPGG